MKRSKIIIFSSDFYPSSMVASRRITFWAQHIKKYLSESITVKVITCNQSAKKLDEIDELHILKEASIGPLRKLWNLIQLNTILRKETTPSVIIISAGPFYFFLATRFLSSKHRIVFDLRDPYVSDSKNRIDFIKKLFRHFYQKLFISWPHLIVTINHYLLRSYSPPSKIPAFIVPNGFEGHRFRKAPCNKKILILGKVYSDLQKLIDEIVGIDHDIEFHQFINKSAPDTNRLPFHEKVYFHDEISKEKIPSVISDFGIGLVSTYPEDFVMPVKIFDYTQAGMKVLVVNDKDSEQTELKEFLRNYPRKLFISNHKIDPIKFKAFLDEDTMTPNDKLFPEIYFRENSTRDLAEQLKSFFDDASFDFKKSRAKLSFYFISLKYFKISKKFYIIMNYFNN